MSKPEIKIKGKVQNMEKKEKKYKDSDTEKSTSNLKTAAPEIKKSVVTNVAPKVLVQRENFLIRNYLDRK